MKRLLSYALATMMPLVLGGCFIEGGGSSSGDSYIAFGTDGYVDDDFYYDEGVGRYDYVVQVHAYDRWGYPIYGAWVDVIVSDTPEIVMSGVTDPDGFASFVVYTQPDTVITAIVSDSYLGESFDTGVTDWDDSLVTLQVYF